MAETGRFAEETGRFAERLQLMAVSVEGITCQQADKCLDP